jgi:dihydropteroate synthase
MIAWRLAKQSLVIDERPLVMGILNVTPDSFSDGGLYDTPEIAIARGLAMAAQGADLIDVGGESTRPGATLVPLDVELARVVPVVKALTEQTVVPIAVDTSKAEVARQCLQRGAQAVNDVTALTGDQSMAMVVRDFAAGVVLMHMQGTPATMQVDPQYGDVVADISRYLRRRIKACVKAGIELERIVIDPGIGFGKTLEHTLTLLARLEELQKLKRPVLLGVSRKGFIGQIVDRPRSERVIGSVATVCYAMARGAVQIVRAHDVRETVEAARICGKIWEHRRRR